VYYVSKDPGLDFRDQLIAAPLKLAGVPAGRVDRIAFPRSIDRGPIEAQSRCGRSKRNRDFRDQLIAAPLKRPEGFERRTEAVYFRDQLIAAPLKLGGRANIDVLGPHFRDQLIAAPLKPFLFNDLRPPPPAFPRSIDRGPIEAKPAFPELI